METKTFEVEPNTYANKVTKFKHTAGTQPCKDYKAIKPYDLTDEWNNFLQDLVNREDNLQ